MYFLYLPLFFVELILFKLFKKHNSEICYKFFLKYYSIFGPKFNFLISQFLSNDKRNLEKLINQKKILLDKSFEKKIIHRINEEGFSIKKKVLSDETINKILSFLKKTKGFYISEDLKSKKREILDQENPKALQFIYKTEDILQCAEIQKMICNKEILSIAQKYLGCLPIFDFLSMYWSFYSKKADKEAAQYWHFDMDRPKWLKIFFYLTDVNKNNGPHMFISGTHLRGKKNLSEIRKRGYVRLSDEEIYKRFNKKEIQQFCLPKGSILFEDTSGLHKGLKINSGKRLLFMIQFSSSTFGAQKYGSTKKIKINNATDELKIAKLNYEKIFPNIII